MKIKAGRFSSFSMNPAEKPNVRKALHFFDTSGKSPTTLLDCGEKSYTTFPYCREKPNIKFYRAGAYG